MNGVDLTLQALHHGEQHLVKELTTVAERHRTDHEVHHVATDLAAWSREHVQRVSDAGRDRGLHLGDAPKDHTRGLLPALRERAAETLGHRPEPALVLLHDLRDLHLAATQNSLHWEMLAQAAQATRNDALLSLASACHPQTLRQMRWTNTMIKVLSPQALSSL
ncbi:hypothetical protein OG440_02340 [Streptomyces sp. NBC_00637]|uniref:hypothetical protein n=1 Tax=Streptomyces sp. NBC_00637 TaxID=2903667 RepID=UPI00324CB265